VSAADSSRRDYDPRTRHPNAFNYRRCRRHYRYSCVRPHAGTTPRGNRGAHVVVARFPVLDRLVGDARVKITGDPEQRAPTRTARRRTVPLRAPNTPCGRVTSLAVFSVHECFDFHDHTASRRSTAWCALGAFAQLPVAAARRGRPCGLTSSASHAPRHAVSPSAR